jgi:hypothetical protein
MTDDVAAHTQKVSHSYVVHYPEHAPRQGDPNYVDFNAFHRKWGPTARCAYALHATLAGDADPTRQTSSPFRLIGPGEVLAGCDTTHPMELHHAHIEFSLQQGVDLRLLEKDYPGVSDPNQVGAWVESGDNFTWLCTYHHRGPGGAHTAAASDYEAEKYVLGLIS